MWTQAAGVVQVLGEPVQVPVQPVGVAHVSQALEGEAGWADGPDQKQGVPRVGGNARGRKRCGQESWLLALALAPTCWVTLNKAAMRVGMERWLSNWS